MSTQQNIAPVTPLIQPCGYRSVSAKNSHGCDRCCCMASAVRTWLYIPVQCCGHRDVMAPEISVQPIILCTGLYTALWIQSKWQGLNFFSVHNQNWPIFAENMHSWNLENVQTLYPGPVNSTLDTAMCIHPCFSDMFTALDTVSNFLTKAQFCNQNLGGTRWIISGYRQWAYAFHFQCFCILVYIPKVDLSMTYCLLFSGTITYLKNMFKDGKKPSSNQVQYVSPNRNILKEKGVHENYQR